MKTLHSVVLLFVLAVILMACPYKSAVGIDEGPSVKMNTDLLGTWRKSNYPADSTELIFSTLNTKKFLVKATITDNDGGYEKSTFWIWFSTINKMQLITLYDIENKKYSFGELELPGNHLDIKLFSEDITTEQFTTTAAMRTFIETIYARNQVKFDDDADLTDLVK
jgi:hypothetical protein